MFIDPDFRHKNSRGIENNSSRAWRRRRNLMSCANLVSMARVVLKYCARSFPSNFECREIMKSFTFRQSTWENAIPTGKFTKERESESESPSFTPMCCVASAQSTDGTARSAGKPCFSLRRFSFLTKAMSQVPNYIEISLDFVYCCLHSSKYHPSIFKYNIIQPSQGIFTVDHLSIICRQSFFASPLSCSTQAPQARICCPGWCTVLTARALWRGFAASLSGVNWWEWWVACSLRLILGSHTGWFFMLCWVG